MSFTTSDAWQETVYLLRSPANAERLMKAVERDRDGSATVAKTRHELIDLAGNDNTCGSE